MITNNKNLIKECRAVLTDILRENLTTYTNLFFYEKEVDLDQKKAEILQRAGILKRNNGKWYAAVMVFPFRGKFIVTDFLFSIRRRRNNIFIRT